MAAIKRRILDRYSLTDDKRVIVDASVGKVEDLYSNFDRTMPYVKKDLDEEFAEYLTGCAREIGGTDFVIRIDLTFVPDEPRMSRVRSSIRNYFLYMEELEKRRMLRMFRTSLILLSIGVFLLVLSISVNRLLPSDPGVVGQVFAEGLTVAAWVSLWEALATFLIQWKPRRREMRLYRRIADAEVTFRQYPADP
jgi:hypothetical protein